MTLPSIRVEGELIVANLAPWADEFDRQSAGERFTAADFVEWLRLEALGADPGGELHRELTAAARLRGP